MTQDLPLMRRVGFALLTASIPILVMFVLLTLQGVQWDDYAPVMGDEIMYWHQAATWTRVGLDSGFYSIDSLTAPAARYFCWGLGPVIFYGTFGNLLGWSLNSILYINLVFFFLCIVAFVLLARLDVWRCAWLAVMLAVYPAVLVYLPTSMIEPIHLGGALVIAGGLYRLHQGERDPWVFALTGVTLLLLSLLKITWVPIFWPFFYYLTAWRPSRLANPLPASDSSQGANTAVSAAGKPRVWVAFALMVTVGLVIYVFYSFTAAPYPYAFMKVLGEIRTDLSLAFWHYGDLVTENIIWLFYPSDLASNSTRFAVIALIIWSIWAQRRARSRLDREAVRLVLYSLGVVLALAVLVYATQSHRGHRLFAPYLMLVFGLMLAWGRMPVVRALVGLFILTLPMVLLSPDLRRENYFNPLREDRIAVHQQEFKEAGIVYRAGADPWCNAFAHSIRYLSELADQDRLLAIEPGMGMTILWEHPEKMTPAQYVMLDDVSFQLYPNQASLTPLIPVQQGMVYRNNATDCS